MILGFIAGAFTTVAFVPQVYQAFKTRKVNDLSWGLAVIYWIGICLWLIYGLLQNDDTIIVANSCSLFLATLLIFAKIKYNKNEYHP